MMGMSDYYAKHLQITQKKIETLEIKKENCPAWKLEEVLNEITVLKEIEDFLWKKL